MALAASRNVDQRNNHAKQLGYGTILTAVKVYEGALLAWTSTGRITVCANAATLSFAGLAEDEYDTGDGVIEAKFSFGQEAYLPVAAAVTTALIGDTRILAVDDETATTATTLAPEIGALRSPVSSGYAWVGLRVHVATTQT